MITNKRITYVAKSFTPADIQLINRLHSNAFGGEYTKQVVPLTEARKNLVAGGAYIVFGLSTYNIVNKLHSNSMNVFKLPSIAKLHGSSGEEATRKEAWSTVQRIKSVVEEGYVNPMDQVETLEKYASISMLQLKEAYLALVEEGQKELVLVTGKGDRLLISHKEQEGALSFDELFALFLINQTLTDIDKFSFSSAAQRENNKDKHRP